MQRPKGTSDLLPGAVEGWQRLEKTFREVSRAYHFHEIRTPVFEHTELFVRGVGDTTDIVSKEMYTFEDKAGRSVTLRPEGTAGVVRAYVENKLYGQPDVVKLYYMGPMFRYEKPQKGRERQFHQYGCEVLGSGAPEVDAEMIAFGQDFLTRLGLQDVTIELNSVGCSDCRPVHKEEMLRRLRPVADRLCQDCQQRLEKNPLRIFDCKNESCQAVLKEVEAPTILACLCEPCRTHFTGVKMSLNAMDIPFVVNEYLVRGLDYYTRTAWEFTVPGFSTVAGGGRYNKLVENVGGPETPGVGFAGGIERALLVLREQGKAVEPESEVDVFVVVADETASQSALRLLHELRQHGLVADRDYQGKGVKAQFRAADRIRAKYVMILGESEVSTGVVAVKDLQSGEQTNISRSGVVPYILEKVEGK